jgi:hypothetical protein
MAKLVVILGAGASASFGVPTLRNLFKDPHAIEYLQANTRLRDQLERQFWGPRGHTLETSHASLTVEEMLTLVREQSIALTRSERTLFQRSLYVLIKKAIYDGKSSRGAHLNRLIAYADKAFDEVLWASFNWDCIFEASFYYSGGTSWVDRRNPTLVIDVVGWRNCGRKHFFLKLHGGINWWFDGERICYLPFGRKPDLDNRWKQFEAEPTNERDMPVILEPSYYKYSDPMYDRLRPQWDAFEQTLQVADYILVLGYSLPEADFKARATLMRAFQLNPAARWIVIDSSPDICTKYGRLFGNRNVTCLRMPLQDFTQHLDDCLDELNWPGVRPRGG